MQCRICFEDGDETTLLTPCRCSGTSSYIHRTCLDRYIQYYPDRICRVCQGTFVHSESTTEFSLCWIMFSLLISLLLFSNVRILAKLVLLLMTVGISLFFLHHNLFSTTPLVFISIIAILCLPGGHPSATNMWFIVIAVIMIVYTLVRQFPAMILLAVLVTLLLAGYVIFLTMFAYHSLDSPAFTVYLSVIYLAWYAWIHNETRLRFA